MRYLILGGGPAGIAAAKAIRKRETDAAIVIVTEETAQPYELRKGKRAEKLNAAENRVHFTDGTEEGYDFLLIATGGKPILPDPLKKPLGSILPFDSLADALRIKERATRPGNSVVYGPGYLAIEACRVLRKAGQNVTWLKPGQPRFGNPIAGEFEASVINEIQYRGVVLKDGAEVESVTEADEETAIVRTISGEEIRCRMIVAATERLPCTEFLEGSGVKAGTGIVVDDYLRTFIGNVYAAGDCAELHDKTTGQSRINFGWRSAIKQGQLAGENMAGGGKLYIRKQEDYLWLLFGTSLLDRSK
jgi:NADPH-dependent 2,4-dienoyl-CoA reductase/sulfur reductase-like enzyme